MFHPSRVGSMSVEDIHRHLEAHMKTVRKYDALCREKNDLELSHERYVKGKVGNTPGFMNLKHKLNLIYKKLGELRLLEPVVLNRLHERLGELNEEETARGPKRVHPKRVRPAEEDDDDEDTGPSQCKRARLRLDELNEEETGMSSQQCSAGNFIVAGDDGVEVKVASEWICLNVVPMTGRLPGSKAMRFCNYKASTWDDRANHKRDCHLDEPGNKKADSQQQNARRNSRKRELEAAAGTSHASTSLGDEEDDGEPANKRAKTADSQQQNAGRNSRKRELEAATGTSLVSHASTSVNDEEEDDGEPANKRAKTA